MKRPGRPRRRARERKTTGTCYICGGTIYSPTSIKLGICGMCHRDVRARFNPRMVHYLLSRGLSLE